MIAHYISYSISITFISWIVGMFVNGILVKMEYYKNLLNLNIVKSETINKRMGLSVFKWIVKKAFFKFFNPKLKLKNRIEMTDK
ncbi:MAG: hypothetical protein JEZ09_21270 [Salinivirgaceae bacterium]|nr:hypothetical protein [Salinivirgaceae bacterium]